MMKNADFFLGVLAIGLLAYFVTRKGKSVAVPFKYGVAVGVVPPDGAGTLDTSAPWDNNTQTVSKDTVTFGAIHAGNGGLGNVIPTGINEGQNHFIITHP